MSSKQHLGVEQGISGDVSDAAMNNPSVLAHLQEGITYDTRLQAMANYQSLPEPVKRRVRALKKLQYRTLEVEADFYRELHALEMRYAGRYADQLEARHGIVTGGHEPTDEEADWPETSESELQLAALAQQHLQQRDKAAGGGAIEAPGSCGGASVASSSAAAIESGGAAAASGVPNFWLTVLKNVELVGQMIQKHDEPILQHLTDIRASLFTSDDTAGGADSPAAAGFKLEFHFSPNAYFANSVLTKHYYLRMAPDRRQPWSYDGPEIVRCRGCDIQWRKGKNVTVKILKKVQRHRGNGQRRTITKTVETDSFFNFFNPPTQAIGDLNEDDSEDEEIENLLQSDFEVGHFIRERIVTRAALYFTGEGLEDEDEFEEEEDAEDEGSDTEVNDIVDDDEPTDNLQARR